MKKVTIHQYPMGTPPLVFENVTLHEPVYLGEFTYLLIKGVDFGFNKVTYESYIPLGNVVQIDTEGDYVVPEPVISGGKNDQ